MVINNRFSVDASRNEVSDKMKRDPIRLEPRLVKLLCLLIENRGRIVKRELIIKEVWDDYPGAGESLNQAISGLRKLLEDHQKNIIETIPKSGYCFHGSVDEPEVKPQTKSFKATYILAGSLVIIALLFLVRYYQSTEAVISEQASREENRAVSKIDSARQAERFKADSLNRVGMK